MLKHHEDRPPGALAHGAVQSSSIERVRRDMGQAERRIARRLDDALTRHRQAARSARVERPHPRMAATAGRAPDPESPTRALPAGRTAARSNSRA